jgi:hypothetical protein
MACEYGPIAFGAVSVDTTCFTAVYAAFVTLPDRIHLVQTRIRLIPPPIIARTV